MTPGPSGHRDAASTVVAWPVQHDGRMSDGLERFQEITKSGVVPSPSGAGGVVIHAQEGFDCRVIMGVLRLAGKAHKIAIVTLVRCMPSVFGYPHDEAYRHDPRGAAGDRPGYGFYEVLSSTWPQRLIACNRHAFPDSTPRPLRQLPALLHRLPRRIRRVPGRGPDSGDHRRQL